MPMDQEFETQVLDIDKERLIKKLRKLGAAEEEEQLQRRWVFDLDPCTAKSTGEWIRLRQVGERKPTITYKNKKGAGICDTKEIELTVDNFETAHKLLSMLPFKGNYYQENRRHKFILKGIEFTLDTWPKIPTFLEVEAKSEEKVHEGLRLLGLEGKDAGHIGMIAIYQKYNITIHDIPVLKF